jgi:hypothetical protein
VTAPLLVCSAVLLVLLIVSALSFTVILTQFLVFLGIFYFVSILVVDLSYWVVEVGLLVYGFIPDFLGVSTGDYDLILNRTVVGVVCLVSTYLTLVLG